MTKIQSDREIFYGVCRFFSSNAWWRPVIEFIYYNCRLFQQSLKYSTVHEHRIYLKFLDMICDRVDNYMCSKLHITPDIFENLMAKFLNNPNDKSQVIFAILRQATNYQEFCKQMHLYNRKIENSITRALLKFAEDETITNKEDLAIKVAEQIEIDQNNEIAELVHKSCVQTKKLMAISPVSANGSNTTPTRKGEKSNPKKNSNANESFTNLSQPECNWNPKAKKVVDTSSVSHSPNVDTKTEEIQEAKTIHESHSHHHSKHRKQEFDKVKPNIDHYFMIEENTNDNLLELPSKPAEDKSPIERKNINQKGTLKTHQSKQPFRKPPTARKQNTTIQFESP